MTAWHTAPDGRRFRVYLGRCLCSPCWQARCVCGTKLTAHAFTADSAVDEARDAMQRADEHALCKASMARQPELPL